MLASKDAYTSDPTEYGGQLFERFAIYFVPSYHTRLSEFGRRWFGYDLDSGVCERNYFNLNPAFVEKITSKPSKYGLHATLKAPFYMSQEQNLDHLIAKLSSFSANRKSFELGFLKCNMHGGCLSLVLENNSPINHFASQCVLGFESFRAPLSVKERTRRLEKPLTIHQRLMLEELGYPYVLSEFRFHITLSQQLVENEKEVLQKALSSGLNEICKTPVILDNLALVGDLGHGQPFKLIKRFSLGST